MDSEFYWVYEAWSACEWRIVAHNAETTRLFEVGVRASLYERLENAAGTEMVRLWTWERDAAPAMVGPPMRHLRLV
jgi:hypothetical protein